ncbi:hypothetical protein ACFRKB_24075 [Streptomyces scopuliridis]|uniref:hypothetical protein n=1 Tax=Streptomyces scopuliridis TaxID=452529 RepID=UPI0036CFC99D
MKQRKKIATTVAALAALSAAGIATAGPAAAGDDWSTAAPAAVTTVAGDDWITYAPTAVVASWGPYKTSAGLKEGNAICEKTGRSGVDAGKWKSYSCDIKGLYVYLSV